MTWGEFFSDRAGGLLLHLVGMAALSAFLLATGAQSGVVVLILLVWLLGLAVSVGADYVRRSARLRELEAVLNGLDRKYLFAECAPRPKGAYERRLFDLLRRSGRAMVGAVSDAQTAQRDYREYVEGWVHEIKGPITAAQLICRGADPDTRRKLAPELAQIEDHVERALFYARAESPERDFLIRQTSLADIVHQALERQRVLLLHSGVRLEAGELEGTVYTDGKWAAFLLGQLLQNAVRYRGDDPAVVLSARTLGRRVQLTVADNGVGIPAQDLPRIFDRGFTGSNGRARGGATGMGLYICRKLADLLQIDLGVRSAPGEGTRFTLTFPAREDLSKV